MDMKRITSGLLAGALITTGALALAAPAGATVEPSTCTTTEHWPATAEGRPAAHPETDGVYVWHTSKGWRLRVNDPGTDRAIFTGSVKVDGQIFGVGRHLENGAEGVVHRGTHAEYFRFVNYGGGDGMNFGTRCSTTLTVNVKRNGVTVAADHVYIGAAGSHPTAVPFSIAKTA